MFGFVFTKDSGIGLELVGLERGVDEELGLLGEGGETSASAVRRPATCGLRDSWILS
jgi:hypothetical protein